MSRCRKQKTLTDNEIMVLWDNAEDDHPDGSTMLLMEVVCDMARQVGVEMDHGDVAAALGRVAERTGFSDA